MGSCALSFCIKWVVKYVCLIVFGGTVLELYYKLFSYLCIQSASIIFSSLDTFLTVYSLLSQEIGELK